MSPPAPISRDTAQAPDGAVLAAIVAAVEAAWARPTVGAPPATPPPVPTWRWSGRWWAPGRAVAAERRRP